MNEVPAQFDPLTIADTLGTPDPVPRIHQAYGPGFRFALNAEGWDNPTADLEVYPHSNVVRYVSDASTHLLRFDDRPPYVTDECVVFEGRTPTRQASMVFTRDGSFSFFESPTQPKSETQLEWEQATREVRDFTEQVDKVAGEIAASREDASSERKENGDRVKIEGRLGRGVRVSQNNRGVRVNFELYEDTDAGEVLHDVFSTSGKPNQRFAERIRDSNYQQGEEVRVVGQRQRHPIKDTDETKEVIYAYAVKRLKEPNGG